jgi:hypothetical protein
VTLAVGPCSPIPSTLQSPLAPATLASMSDHDRDLEGGGLAVLIVAIFLALLLVLCGGGAIVLYRRLAIEQGIPVDEPVNAAATAKQAPIDETPAPSAPESPPPTQ